MVGENRLLQVILWPPHYCTPICGHTHTHHTQTDKQIKLGVTSGSLALMQAKEADCKRFGAGAWGDMQRAK